MEVAGSQSREPDLKEPSSPVTPGAPVAPVLSYDKSKTQKKAKARAKKGEKQLQQHLLLQALMWGPSRQ